jgi:hypothetical protein
MEGAMIPSRRWTFRAGLSAAVLALGGLALGALGLKASRAAGQADPNRDISRQVTVFAIVATPGGKSIDTRLTAPAVQQQLNRLLPDHGFTLLDAQSSRLVAGESVECKLDHGYTAETVLVRPIDEDGKVHLRCELSLDGALQFSAAVRAPLNQLFFCERPYLTDGSKLLIGVGARP